MNFVKIPGKNFEIMDTPVTQKEYKYVMKINPSYFKGPNNPVESISWNDCKEFIEKMNKCNDRYNYRLPKEKEWEYCAKSCDEQKLEDIAWFIKNSNNKTHIVKQKKPNKFRLYDMLGNVWEWCEDLYNDSASNRVIRGGSWFINAQDLRSAARSYVGPGHRYSDVGFRLVRTSLNSALLHFNASKECNFLDKIKQNFEE